MNPVKAMDQFVFGKTFLPHSLTRAKKLDRLMRNEQGLFLDFGSADCKAETFITNKDIRFIAFDIEEKEVVHARKRNVNAILADGRRLPFKDGSFDDCVSAEVLEHIDNEVGAATSAKDIPLKAFPTYWSRQASRKSKRVHGKGLIAWLGLTYYNFRYREEVGKSLAWKIIRMLFVRGCLGRSLLGIVPWLDALFSGEGLDVYGIYYRP